MASHVSITTQPASDYTLCLNQPTTNIHVSRAPAPGARGCSPEPQIGLNMRVALIVDNLATGGTEQVVRELAVGLIGRGHHACIYCLRDAGPAAIELRRRGVIVRAAHSGPRDVALPIRLGVWLRRDRIHIVNAHGNAALVAAFTPTRTLGLPLIQTRHSSIVGRTSRYGRLARLLSYGTTRLTIVSETLRAQLPPGRIASTAVHIPNGLTRPTQPRTIARRRLADHCGIPLPDDTPAVLSVGTVCVEKDTIGLLHAFAKLRERLPAARLVLVGGVRGEAYERIFHKYLKDQDLSESVHWLGNVADAYQLMAGADVFCLASVTEGMPLVIIEAMTQGVPIVATTVGDVGRLGEPGRAPQFVLRNRETALLVPPRAPDALADALHETLTRRQQAADRAVRARAEATTRFSTETMVRQYESLYAQFVCNQKLTTQIPTPTARPNVLMIGPAAPRVGGMVTSIKNLLRSDLRHEYDLRLFPTTYDPAPPTSTAHTAGQRWLRRGRSAMRHLGALGALFNRLIRDHAQLVHIHTCSGPTFYRNSVDVLLARTLRRKVVLHIRGGQFAQFCQNETPLRQRYIRAIAARTDAIVVLSHSWRQELQPLLPDARLVVIPNGIDPSCTATTREKNHTEPRDTAPCRFLYLAPLTTTKGLRDLLEAAARLARDATPFKLDIAGPQTTTTPQAHWQRLATHLGLSEHIRFHGPVFGDAKQALLAHADVFLLPSHHEGFPNTLLEAATAGLPVIATTVGAIPEAVTPPPEALNPPAMPQPLTPLVPPRDPDALARAMLQLAGAPDHRTAIGPKLRAHILANFNMQRVARDVADLYATLLGTPQRTSPSCRPASPTTEPPNQPAPADPCPSNDDTRPDTLNAQTQEYQHELCGVAHAPHHLPDA